MIPFASQRGGGQDLATHLQNAYDNEIAEVVEIRGAVADDLHGAFKEWEVQAETLTRCQKYLYSMSINPDPAQGELTREQYFDYIARVEEALGLSDQPRAVVFHTKQGREHCHVVWSRIDAEHQKAVHIGFDRLALMQVTRDFARRHFLDLPAGYDKSRQKGQDSLYERVQQNQTGLSKADHKERVTEAWRHSDDARSFVQALAERGYILATGKRPYVLVDFYGGSHSLAKLIDDKSVRTDELRRFLSRDFPEDSLPSVEEAGELAARHRRQTERALKADQLADRLAELQHAQQIRRLGLTQERLALQRLHQADREKLITRHRAERHQQRRDHVAEMKSTRVRRHELRARGLARFLGLVSGAAAIRRAIHRYQDGRQLEIQRRQRAALSKKQDEEKKAMAAKQNRQVLVAEKKSETLAKIENREVAALERDALRDARVRQRGPENEMDPILQLHQSPEPAGPDAKVEFNRAVGPPKQESQDLRGDFWRASENLTDGVERDDRALELENDGPERSR
ncbi:MAG: relaxase [Sphingomonas sp.]|uniref:Relaxase n=1 Tax=Variovorax paradoxus TaxID=34073 RepID=A0A2W5QAA6_VARPD|nr:relaxase/mobilization nuclease domain-containing protein [Sphingomonas sp.]PZQ75291.1 MAG: relaxase [Variovorax paradoxus]PZU73304.1 MAG: relaxase [Sphingomonas sp.]